MCIQLCYQKMVQARLEVDYMTNGPQSPNRPQVVGFLLVF